MRTFICIFFMLLITNLSYGQSRNERLGNREFDDYNYTRAIERFERIGDPSVEVQRKLAYSHFFMGNLEQAAGYYAAVAASEEHTAEDIWKFYQVLLAQERYELAREQLVAFYAMAPDDPLTQRFSQAGDFITEIQQKETFFEVTNLDFNTLQQDFGVAFYNDQVVFASSRQTVEAPRNPWTANRLPFLLPFVADKAEGGQLRNPRPFMSDFFTGNYHIGPVAFNPDQTMMAVTVNYDTEIKGGMTLNLQLLISRLEEGEWTTPEPLPFNNPDYSVGQASFSPDGRTMYFVSDMPGSKGGTDIYRVSLDAQGNFGSPENLSDINTKGDEMFPYLHEGGHFYFSSDGHPGLGGLDIFHADHSGGSFRNVTNIGTPINSSGDDFAIVLHEDGESGYFSSRRPAGKGNDDIYYFRRDMPTPVLAITKVASPTQYNQAGDEITYNIQVHNPGSVTLSNVLVEDPLTGLSTTIESLPPSGSEQFSETYVISLEDLASRRVSNTVTAQGTAPNGDQISARAEALVQLREFLEVGPIFFDFDKSNIRPDAALELEKVVQVMNDHPNMVVEVGSHTDCRGTDNYNRLLSEARARSTIEYIRERIVNPERISGQGYGKTQLTNRCDCEEDPPCSKDEHQENRRSEFRIIRMH